MDEIEEKLPLILPSSANLSNLYTLYFFFLLHKPARLLYYVQRD